jgi:hypothetical protein
MSEPFKLGAKVGSGLIGKESRPFFLSAEALRQALGKCALHYHGTSAVRFPCERHHWDRITVYNGWRGCARMAWECGECGAGCHAEDPSDERAERGACRA